MGFKMPMCNKQGFISCSVIWRLLHECYNFKDIVSMKIPFFL